MTSIENAKVYYPETIEETPLPGTPYSSITGVPQSLSEINRDEGIKLSGIEIVDGDPQWINDIVNERINTAEKNILSNFTFGDNDFAGGLYAGNIAWNTGTGSYVSGAGIVINRKGIIGANGSQVTFSIDATTGNATFRGDVTASTITGGTISGTTMSASTITGTTITGGTIQTASSGLRIKLSSAVTNKIEFLKDNTVYGLMEVRNLSGEGQVRIVDPYNGNYGLYLSSTIGSGSNTQATLQAQGATVSAGGTGTVYSAQLIVGGNYFGAFRISGNYKILTNLRIESDWLPFLSNNYNLGSSSYRWQDIFANTLKVDSITLNGVTRTTWPSAGATTLSGLTIDTSKNWQGYGITNIDNIQFNGSGSYIDNVSAIYLKSRTSNPSSPVGSIWYYNNGSTYEIRTYLGSQRYRFDLTAV